MLKRHIVCGDHLKTPRYDVRSLCNGFLAGAAAISAGSGVIRPWGGLITGVIESFLYMSMCIILRKFKFDDPMENFSIYFTAGILSMFACAFFTPGKGILWGN
jgi:Amt family ammonium transporter